MRAFIVGFAAGIWLLQSQSSLPEVEWLRNAGALAVGVVLVAVILHRLNPAATRSASVGVLCLAFTIAAGAGVGFVYSAAMAQSRLADALPPAWEGVDIRIAGIVSGLPAVNQSDRSVRFAFDVERVVAPVDAVVPSRISLSWFPAMRGARRAKGDATEAPLPEVHAGERWELVVRLRRPHGNANPHGFDIEAWMLENGLRASGYVRGNDNRRVDAFSGRFIDRVDALRERIRARILRVLDGQPYAGVLVALTIGDQRSVSQDQWALYNRTGVSHLLSISGLHVTLFAAIVGGIVFHLWRRSQWLTTRLPARKAAALLGSIAAFGYVLLAGFEVPAQRTLYMLFVAAAGLWIGRPGTGLTVLAWALLVVLAIDPWAVLAAGFWLSFGAVALLMYAGIGRLRDHRPHAWLHAAVRAQVAITLGMIPLMLALFQQVSVISPVANAFAIPIVSMVVVPIALVWLAVPWDFLLVLAHELFVWVAKGLLWLDQLPSGVWTQHAPPAWAIVAGMFGAVLLLSPAGARVRCLGLVWLLPMFVVMPMRPQPGAMWIEALDVGQGLAVVVQTHSHTLLYDTGARFTDLADAGNRIIAPYLRARGVGRLDSMIVSHADIDHSGGAASLLQVVPVASMLSSLPDDHRLVAERRNRNAANARCEAGEEWEWDGVTFRVLHPTAGSYRDARVRSNDRSCVIQLSSVHGTALLTGDIETKAEAELVAREGEALVSDVMLVPHHGSKTSSTAAFVAAVDPDVAIATVGYRNRFGHPKPEVVARYADRNVRLLRSDRHGAVEVRFDGGPPVIRAWRNEASPYWRERPVDDEGGGSESP